MNAGFTSVVRLIWLTAALWFNALQLRADVVYVWSEDGSIRKIDTNGVASVFVTNNLSKWNGPVGLTLDNVGNLYAGFPGGSYIWRFSPAGNGHLNPGIIDSVSALAFDSAGHLFSTSPNYEEIDKLEYDFGLGYILNGLSTNRTSSHLGYPINIAFDRAGNLFALNNTNASPFFYLVHPIAYGNTIEKFAPNFTDLGTFATNLNCPWGLAFDNQGNLYVANTGDDFISVDTVEKFTPGGVRSTFVTYYDGLSSPRGLAFDSAGNLYVANSGDGTIIKITTNEIVSVVATGLDTPTALAIYPGLNVWSATPITLNPPTLLSDGSFQFNCNDNPGLSFAVLGPTNAFLPFSNWVPLGLAAEISPGLYQFNDPAATNGGQRFYRIKSN